MSAVGRASITVTPGIPIMAATIFSGSVSTTGGYVRVSLPPGFRSASLPSVMAHARPAGRAVLPAVLADKAYERPKQARNVYSENRSGRSLRRFCAALSLRRRRYNATRPSAIAS